MLFQKYTHSAVKNIYQPSIVEEWKANKDKESYEDKLQMVVRKIRVLWTIKMKTKMIRIVLWSNTKTRCIQLKKLKRQKKQKQLPNNQNQRINFKDGMQYHNIGSILILTDLKMTLWPGVLVFQNDTPYTYYRLTQ